MLKFLFFANDFKSLGLFLLSFSLAAFVFVASTTLANFSSLFSSSSPPFFDFFDFFFLPSSSFDDDLPLDLLLFFVVDF